MRTVSASATRIVAAPAGAVYELLADYRTRHREILPPAFSDYRVEEGGTGAGTVIGFTLSAGGRSRPYRMRVAEPEPGRVLTESDTASSLVTTFRLTPEGDRCRVRIETTWAGASGVGGFFERRFAPGALRRIYDEELSRLEGCVRARDTPQA